ncbi:uncharacterized protein LOC131860359 [Cryptomeria japonica]|uniref:uncharacterized protein LOC131860359 n=1 Tax=Cryptomeria japonica TaxID=3369 RepID=UPI0027D9E390|nr:uncharacterized protein LOC131860359 [Cryptomeria japonica]
MVHNLKDNVVFPLVNVYGLIKTEEKAKVWKAITDKIGSLTNDRVMVAGDFNALLDLEEKRGGLRMANKVMEYFREFVMTNHLFDVIPKNGRYTWTNRRENFARILERLDRFLVGPFWLDSAINLDSCILPITLSDHFPVQLSIQEANKIFRGSFRFQGMWWKDKDFLPNVETWWKESDILSGTPSFFIVKRLEIVKKKIKEWNKFSFKNIFAKKNKVEAELDNLNKIVITAGMSNDEFAREKQLKSELSEILLREEVFWWDNSRECWIKEGDLNTKNFHASVKAKRANNRISHI